MGESESALRLTRSFTLSPHLACVAVGLFLWGLAGFRVSGFGFGVWGLWMFVWGQAVRGGETCQ